MGRGGDPGRTAYRAGLHIIRRAIGQAYLLGCGAPILPSLGLVDAMRISADTGPQAAPPDDDWSQPSSRAAALNGASRAFQHGRFWVNNPDCHAYPAGGGSITDFAFGWTDISAGSYAASVEQGRL
jgi:hypothetical protein